MNALQPITDQAAPVAPPFSRIFQRAGWLILLITLLSVGAAILISSLEPKSYLSEAQMVLVQRPISVHLTGTGDTMAVTQMAPELETVDTQMGMLQSTGMYQHTMDWLKNDALAKGQSTTGFDDMTPKQFSHDVAFVNPRNSNLLVVDAEAEDPQKAAVLANAVVQAFSQWKRELASRDLMDSTRRIADQTRQYQVKLTKAEEKRTAFNERHHIVDLGLDAKTAFDLVESRQQDAASARQDYNAQQARLSALASQLKSANVAIQANGGGRNDVLTLGLETQLAQLEIERDATAKQYTSAFPGKLEPIDAQIRSIKVKLKAAVASTVGGGGQSLASQSGLVDAYKQQQALTAFTAARLAATGELLQQARETKTALPMQQLMEERLTRDVDLATTQYTNMQAALDAARLDLQRVSGNIQVTQSAYLPDRPYKPNWPLNVALGLILGLLLSFGVAVLRDGMDRRIHSLEDVRRLIAGPIVATLPRLSRRMLTSSAEGESVPEIADSFRVARVNLTLRMHKMARKLVAPQQVILVTSAVAGEGKSLTAANLARSFAEGGGHVDPGGCQSGEPVSEPLLPPGRAGGPGGRARRPGRSARRPDARRGRTAFGPARRGAGRQRDEPAAPAETSGRHPCPAPAGRDGDHGRAGLRVGRGRPAAGGPGGRLDAGDRCQHGRGRHPPRHRRGPGVYGQASRVLRQPRRHPEAPLAPDQFRRDAVGVPVPARHGSLPGPSRYTGADGSREWERERERGRAAQRDRLGPPAERGEQRLGHED